MPILQKGNFDERGLGLQRVAREFITHLRRGPGIVLGVGNPLKSDDGAGVVLFYKLKPALDKLPNIDAFDAGSAPENYLGKILGSDYKRVVLIDAADFGDAHGAIRVFKADEIGDIAFPMTHNISLDMVQQFLAGSKVEEIIILAIQGGNFSPGTELSEPVEDSIEKFGEIFLKEVKKDA